MSEQLRESVSALMDGEADELEVRRLLADDSDTVRSTWARYHLAQDVMNQRSQAFTDLDISARVSEAIADGATDSVASAASTQWLKPVAGFAVAASVAMAVVFGVQTMNPASPEMSATAPAIASRVYPAQGNSAVGSVAVSAGTQSSAAGLPGADAQADLAAQERLEKYMLRHTERAALNNGQGMISFARVASFEVE